MEMLIDAPHLQSLHRRLACRRDGHRMRTLFPGAKPESALAISFARPVSSSCLVGETQTSRATDREHSIAFVNAVAAQRGKHLTTEQAEFLTAAANRIILALGGS
jgi:hypothetical protein